MKKYLFLALAVMVFAACSKSDDQTVNGPVVGDVEKSYIAVSLQAAGETRADDGVYAEGTAEERAVKQAYFFFFDAEGNAFPVNSSIAEGTQTGAKNYVTVASLTDNGQAMDNVSDIKNAVLVINRYKGNFPAKLVAVLNWTPAQDTYSLSELANTLVGATNSFDGTAYFVMSNSVYMNGASVAVNANDIVMANICESADDALAAPITVYVERVAAKITTTLAGATDSCYNTGTQIGGKDVYVKVLGWDVTNTKADSYMLKHINTSWENDALGFTWNDPTWYRSYWADSNNSAPLSSTFSYDEIANAVGANIYCGENVTSTAADRTKMVIKAQLQDEDGNAFDISKWYGNDFASEADMRIAVANTLRYDLMLSSVEGTTTTYTSIKPEQIKCVAGSANAEAYEVTFALADGVATTGWYKYNSATGTYGEVDAAAVLAAVQPAIVYKGGQSYYHLDIRHLAAKDSGKDGEFGIVRNHVYQVNITGISGLGTPVYEGNQQIEEVETPTETESFVASEIRILSWRVVAQDVVLQ